MVKLTTPMGWNSWNTFAQDISEKLIFETADAMVKNGLSDAGYKYLVIDDCWALKERNQEGRLVPDPGKFPKGIKAVAEYLHSKGLKLGMYSCAGNLTCAGYPGSFEHEFTDADTFAEWGVDFLKYDYCNRSGIIHGKYLFRRMGLALKNCGRDILFSACTWGADNTHSWIRETAADIWRSTGDISDQWSAIKRIADQQKDILPYGGVGCFNDMDMLTVGMYGKGNVGITGLNDGEYKTHFSIWALFGSPLMIGCDVRNINDATLKILTNKKLIEINQDPACRQVFKIGAINQAPDVRCYARLLDNGDICIGCFNLGEENVITKFTTDELGLPESTGKTLLMKNLWDDETIRITNGTFVNSLSPHGTLIYRCMVVDK